MWPTRYSRASGAFINVRATETFIDVIHDSNIPCVGTYANDTAAAANAERDSADTATREAAREGVMMAIAI